MKRAAATALRLGCASLVLFLGLTVFHSIGYQPYLFLSICWLLTCWYPKNFIIFRLPGAFNLAFMSPPRFRSVSALEEYAREWGEPGTRRGIDGGKSARRAGTRAARGGGAADWPATSSCDAFGWAAALACQPTVGTIVGEWSWWGGCPLSRAISYWTGVCPSKQVVHSEECYESKIRPKSEVLAV